jgi:hypothetical protein
MSIAKTTLSRRTVLRGAGVSLGLPILNAMGKLTGNPSAQASTLSTDSIQAPIRMACFYFPNGVLERNWFPEKAGTEFEMPFSLQPLERHRKKLTVFSGLDKQHSHNTGDGHYSKTANYLTGLAVRKTTGKDISVGGISIDQLAAQRIGHLTPLPSLELGIDPVISGIDTIVGYTRLYGSYISWRSPSQPLAREINPRFAYERLFGVLRASRESGAFAGAIESKPSKSSEESNRFQTEQRLLLDTVLEDAKSLRGQLGRDDQFKMDEYLDSVRDVEKRVNFFSNPDPRDWHPATAPDLEQLAAPKGEPGDHQEHVRLMMDLIALAFWTDSTRISTFMYANDVSNKNFGQIIPGTNGAHHEFSHHQNKAEKMEPYSKITRWHNEQLAYLMDKLDSIQEGERTLLDNCMILSGSAMSDGDQHKASNIPVLIGGLGGGKIRGGQHLASPEKTPLCNLYVSMLDRMGTPVESFGDSTEAIEL